MLKSFLEIFDLRALHPRNINFQSKKITEKTLSILKDIDRRIKTENNHTTKAHKRTLLTLLYSIPFWERGLEWSEREVQVNIYLSQKKARCSILHDKIIKAYASNNNYEKLNDYLLRIQISESGISSTEKRLNMPLCYVNKEKLLVSIKQTFEFIQLVKYRAFINSGTLLGSIRDGNFISYDNDIDLAVILKSSDDEDIADEMFALCDKLSDSGIDAICKLSFKSPIIKIKFTSGIVIDIFPAWFKQNNLYIWPYCFGKLEKATLLPLSQSILCNSKFPSPQKPHSILEENYGYQWKIPDSNFEFDWEKSYKQFHNLISNYREKYENSLSSGNS